MDLKELYQKKGEAITQMEIWQAKLNQINAQIIEIVNSQGKEEKKDGAS